MKLSFVSFSSFLSTKLYKGAYLIKNSYNCNSRCSNSVVEYTPRYPEVEGLSLAIGSDNGRQNCGKLGHFEATLKSKFSSLTPGEWMFPFQMGLYHPLDGVTNLKSKLLYFLTPNKKISKRKALAFNRNRCCHLAFCLWLILFHCANAI